MHDHEAVFNLFFRTLPFGGGYVIHAGLANVIEYCQSLHFADEDLAYLASLTDRKNQPLFSPGFLDYLSHLRFTGSIDAIEEGSIAFAREPLLRIRGPLLQCQLLETPLLNMINFQTLIATKAARVYAIAQGDTILEFGLRRSQGIDGGISASRAAYIGGCAATSNTLAGKLYGIPVQGTHAHSWVMAFSDELTAFESYAAAFPDDGIFLVDTYNTLQGVQHAIYLAAKLKAQGFRLVGIRLDSGNLVELSQQARVLLDNAGFQDTLIIGSGELDEYRLQALKEQGAKIAVWGFGTRLTTAFDQPALDGVYKLAAIRKPGGAWQYKRKLSDTLTKVTLPGILCIRRFFNETMPVADVIYDEQLGVADDIKTMRVIIGEEELNLPSFTHYTDIIKPILHQGKSVYSKPTVQEIRQKALSELACLPENIRQFNCQALYPVGIEERLFQMKKALL
jgi:nicotinate phosphoribosyltransferase